MWIIDWLLEQWEKLNYFFTEAWEKAKSLFDLGWEYIHGTILFWKDWLLGQINTAYDTLKGLIEGVQNWAIAAIENAKTALQSAIDAVSRTLTDTINATIDWINTAFGRVWDYFATQAKEIYDTVRPWVDAVYTWVTEAIDTAIEAVYTAIDNISVGFHELVDTAIAEVTKIINDVVTGFSIFKQTWEALLAAFFSNPARFIFALIEAWVYDWFQWFGAFLLGSVEAILPERPDLFGPGADFGQDGHGGGPVTGSLIYPTDYHTISGYTFQGQHAGVDFGTPYGTPVWAADGGQVTTVIYGQTGYGYHVILDHGNGWKTLYAHLSVILVQPNQNVSQRQNLGMAGSTGNSTGPHLHFETIYNGGAVNPLTVLH